MELLWATIVTPALVSTSPPLLRSPFAAPRAILTLEESGGGALAAAGSQLEQVLGSLPPNEKYNAVLTSLLSAGSSKSGAALELVEEMTSKGLPMSSDALKSLVDAAVDEGTPESLLGSLRVAKGNGVCRAFATPQLRLPGKPSSSELNSLSPTPTDGRASEVAAATAFSAATALLLLAELLDLFDFLIPGEISAPPPGFVLFALAAGWAFDRYARAGETFGLIGRGLTRLFSRDLQRECAVESASFLLGYLLGLPCCPFAPTVFKPLDMLTTVRAPPCPCQTRLPPWADGGNRRVTQSGGEMERDIGAPARLVDRVLIWLLAPAAVETLVYR